MNRLAAWIGGIMLCAYMIAGFSPLANYISAASGARAIMAPADAIIILGANLNPDGSLSSTSLFREVKGIECYRQGLAPLLMFLGSETSVGNEANARALLARRLGVPDSAILTEARAHTTRQEAQYCAQDLCCRRLRRILLVTDSQHMVRAKAVFERFGFTVFPVPANDFPNPAFMPEDRVMLLRRCGQEWVAQLYYKLTAYL